MAFHIGTISILRSGGFLIGALQNDNTASVLHKRLEEASV